MRFVIQDANSNSGYLLEELLLAAKGATSGGAFYAWTTMQGSSAFLEDEATQDLLTSGEFSLIVGVDAVTNRAAVSFLIEQQRKHRGLTVKAVVHGQSSIFHPKVAWFSADNGQTVLIVGSGNLSLAGLRRNWEAFIVQELDEAEARATINQALEWMVTNDAILASIDDPVVMDVASSNTGVEPRNTHIRKNVFTEKESLASADDVLIAEIPKSDNRWGQANFDRVTYEGFFGAEVGSQRRIILYQVDENGELGKQEVRPSVEVRSRNWRFELSAARGLAYPTTGRPIGVFRRVSAGVFLYTLELPGTIQHQRFLDFIEAQPDSSQREIRRYVLSQSEVEESIAQYQLWDANIPEY